MAKGDVVVRIARAADAGLLADWNLRLARESEGLELEPQRLALGVGRALSDAQRGVYRVAEIDGEPVGCLMVTREWSDWRDGWWWWIQSVYVEPAARGRGVYDALHAAVLEAARAAGDVVGVRLYVEKANARARRVYERCGMHASEYDMLEQPLS